MADTDISRMKLACRDEAQFHAEFAAKLSNRVFVPMAQPKAPGSQFPLHIRFSDGTVRIKGTAEVVKVVSVPKDGVMARFISLDPDSIQFSIGTGSSPSTPGFSLSSATVETAAYAPPTSRTTPFGSATQQPLPTVEAPAYVPPPLGSTPYGATAQQPLPTRESPAHVPAPPPSAPKPVVSPVARTADVSALGAIDPEIDGVAPDSGIHVRSSGSMGKIVAGVLAVLALIAVAAVGITLVRKPAATVAPGGGGEAAQEAMIEGYLAEAERLVKEGKVIQANDVLNRSDQITGGTPKQASRLAQLKADVHLATALAAAQRDLDNGDQEAALKSVNDALGIDPHNAKAKALLQSIKKPSATPPPPVPVVPEPVAVAPQPVVVPVRPGVVRRPPPPPPRRPGQKTPPPEPEPVPVEPPKVVVAPEPVKPEVVKPEPAKVADPVKPPEPVKVAVVTPTPVEPPKAGGTAPQKPRLPETHEITSVQELTKTFSIVEKEIASRGGLPAGATANATVPLAEQLIAGLSPGTPITIYPKAMYWFVVDRARSGESPGQIGKALKAEHLQGSLPMYHPKSAPP